MTSPRYYLILALMTLMQLASCAPVCSETTTIDGKVSLLNYGGDVSGIEVTVTLRNLATGDVQETTGTLDNLGSYRLTGVAPGVYDIAFKAGHWLLNTVYDVGAPSSCALNVALVNGDAVSDDSIDMQDYWAVQTALCSKPGLPGWNPNADLDGDNKIGMGDILIVLRNYGRRGNDMYRGSCTLVRDSYCRPITLLAQSQSKLMGVAVDLQQWLKQVTKVTLPIVTVPDAGATQGLVLGTSDDFPVQSQRYGLSEVGPDGYLIRSEQNRVWILGNTVQGLENGVYAFLEEIGCRWYFPDPAWTVMPRKTTLTVNIDKHGKPSFDLRRMWYEVGAYDVLLKKNYDAWMKRNRMNGSFQVSNGHSYFQYVPASNFSTHPEWFALVDGVRQCPPDYWQLCLSNPEVRQELTKGVLNAFKNNPEQNMVSIEPNDGGKNVYCQCANCLALGSQSNQVFGIANMVAREVSRNYPGKWVGMLAYADHSDPPDFQLEPNVFVMATTQYRWGTLPLADQVQAFRNLGAKVGIYDYPSAIGWDFDTPGVSAASKFYQFAQSIKQYRDVDATTYDAQMCLNWTSNGVGVWMASRLFWNPDASPAMLTEDFYSKGFGRSAAPMKRIYERWATGTQFTPAGLRAAISDLNEAYRLEYKSKILARLDHIAMYLHWLRLRQDYNDSVKQGMSSDIIKDRAHTLVVYTRRIANAALIHSYVHLDENYTMFDELYKPLQNILGASYRSTTEAWKVERYDIPKSAEIRQSFASDVAW